MDLALNEMQLLSCEPPLSLNTASSSSFVSSGHEILYCVGAFGVVRTYRSSLRNHQRKFHICGLVLFVPAHCFRIVASAAVKSQASSHLVHIIGRAQNRPAAPNYNLYWSFCLKPHPRAAAKKPPEMSQYSTIATVSETRRWPTEPPFI